jgi:hypothetical protein
MILRHNLKAGGSGRPEQYEQSGAAEIHNVLQVQTIRETRRRPRLRCRILLLAVRLTSNRHCDKHPVGPSLRKYFRRWHARLPSQDKRCRFTTIPHLIPRSLAPTIRDTEVSTTQGTLELPEVDTCVKTVEIGKKCQLNVKFRQLSVPKSVNSGSVLSRKLTFWRASRARS